MVPDFEEIFRFAKVFKIWLKLFCSKNRRNEEAVGRKKCNNRRQQRPHTQERFEI